MKSKYLAKALQFIPAVCLIACQTPKSPEASGVILDPWDIRSAARKEGLDYINGDWQTSEWPMPNYRPVSILVKREGQPDQEEVAYHAWDFNHDGEVDMVEALNSSGHVTMRLFDFNFDGKIDSDQRVLEEGTGSSVEMLK